MWVGEGGFSDGADEGEGGVEHDVSFFCLIDVAVGIGKREGTVVRESATDADNAEEGKEEGGKTKREIVGDGFGVESGMTIEEDEGGEEGESDEYKIPVVQQLGKEDVA